MREEEKDGPAPEGYASGRRRRIAGGSPKGAYGKRYRALLARVSDMVTVSGPDGRIAYANPATERVTGFAPEEFRALNPFDFIHPEDRPRCEEAFEELSRSPGLSLELEHRIRHKDGAWRWVGGTFESLFDDPEVGGLVATVRDVTESKRAEEALRESEARQAFLLRLEDALRHLTDPEAIQFEAARALGEHLVASRVGYAEAQPDGETIVVTRNYTDGVPGIEGCYRYDDFGRERLATYRAGANVVHDDVASDPTLTEAEKARHAGIRVGATASVPLVKDGRLVALLFMHHREAHAWTPDEISLLEAVAARTWDAVERARAEAALRDSEARLRTLFVAAERRAAELRSVLESMTDGVYIGGMEGITLANQPALDQLGFATPEELNRHVGTLAEEIQTRDWETGLMIPLERQAFARALGGERVVQDVRVRHRLSGEERVVRCAAAPIVTDGRVIAAVAVNTDVTEQRRAEAALRESKERLAVIFSRAATGLSEISLSGHFARVNDGLCEMLGRPRGELLGAGVEEVTHPEDAAQSLRAFGRVVETGEQASLDKRYLRPDGTVVWANSALTRLDDARGRPRAVLAVTADLTERKRAEEERERLKSREAAVRAEEAERERISRELHDRVAHSMGVAHQSLELHAALAENAPSRAQEKLALAREATRRGSRSRWGCRST